jgi:hypothetical protein
MTADQKSESAGKIGSWLVWCAWFFMLTTHLAAHALVHITRASWEKHRPAQPIPRATEWAFGISWLLLALPLAMLLLLLANYCTRSAKINWEAYVCAIIVISSITLPLSALGALIPLIPR